MSPRELSRAWHPAPAAELEHVGLFGQACVQVAQPLERRRLDFARPRGVAQCDRDEDVDDDWLGAPMFFASLGGDSYVPLLRECGLEPLRDEVITQHEPGHGDVAFHWVLAQA